MEESDVAVVLGILETLLLNKDRHKGECMYICECNSFIYI